LTNYAYIDNLFRGILANSKAIEGRFHIAHRYGLQELNYDQLGEVIGKITSTKKWPLAILAPPHSNIEFSRKDENWEEFRIIMFFMNKSLYDQIRSSSQTSQHQIFEDWHDMKRCAVNFIRALLSVQYNTKPTYFVVPANKILFIPLSEIGADRASGVRVDFNFRLFIGCNIEDYYVNEEPEYPTTINIDLDGHAEHKL
jgi:hypothetical protein